jgi:hypothetical protein
MLPLTLRAWLALILYDLVVRARGFTAVHEMLRRRRVVSKSPDRRQEVEAVCAAVDEACIWYVRYVPCLHRSAVTTWLLRREGWLAHLVIGFRPVPLQSHAWVEVDGRVVNDRPQYQKTFRVLDRI